MDTFRNENLAFSHLLKQRENTNLYLQLYYFFPNYFRPFIYCIMNFFTEKNKQSNNIICAISWL